MYLTTGKVSSADLHQNLVHLCLISVLQNLCSSYIWSSYSLIIFSFLLSAKIPRILGSSSSSDLRNENF